MISQHIFQEALINPVLKEGANKLYIVSGYATSAMAFHHLNALKKINVNNINIQLIVGMCPKDGLSVSNHRGFQQLVEREFPDNFECSYIMNPPAVHSKVYAWFKDDIPVCGFAGSANYTQTAFYSKQREILTMCESKIAFEYFQNLSSDTIYCTHNDAENFIILYNDKYYAKREKEYEEAVNKKDEVPTHLYGLQSVKVSLLTKQGVIGNRSGLNWGQRPGRDPNQAYIGLPSDIYRTDFFPERTVQFTVHTDDNKVIICSRAQDNGKAIHTPHRNSDIGEYFRNRLSVSSGEPVNLVDLQKYGRTDVDFYKIDSETYYMDFSVT